MKLKSKMHITNPVSNVVGEGDSRYHIAVPCDSVEPSLGERPVSTYIRHYIKTKLPKDTVWVLRDVSNDFSTFCYVWICPTLVSAKKKKAEHDANPHFAELSHPVPYSILK